MPLPAPPAVAARPRRRSPGAAGPRSSRSWLALVGALALLLAPRPASAETVLQKALRTGELVMVGVTDSPPLVSLDRSGQPVGYAIEVARRIDAELNAQVGGKVRLRFVPVASTAAMIQAVAEGGAALACGVPFSWERERQVDFSLPIGLSGLRVLTTDPALDGSPDSLQGRRVAIVRGSLGAEALPALQPGARPVTFETLDAAVTALQQGKVAGVLGDSTVLAGLRRTRNISAARLVPEEPYVTYGVGCILPENNSDLGNIVNLAIARLQAAYLEGRPDAVAALDPWIGPDGVLGVPRERIRTYFQTQIQSREALRQPPTAPVQPAP